MADEQAALDAMVREELGLDPSTLGGSPYSAGGSSFVLFALGAIIPLIPYFVAGGTAAVIAAIAAAAVALELAVTGKIGGAFAVGCDGWLEEEEVEELSGLRRVELPAGLTFGTVQRLHRLGITPAPVADLRYMVYPWVVECEALREAGWRPSYDNAAALVELLKQRAGHHAVAAGGCPARKRRSPRPGRPWP